MTDIDPSEVGWVSTETYCLRLLKCKSCPMLRKGDPHALCGACGCILKNKARRIDEQCPLERWSE